MAEVLVAPARENGVDEVEATLDELEVRERGFPIGAGAALARIRADTKLKMPHCRVLLTTEEVKARLACFDDRLGQAARTRNIVVLDN